jgi:hypothetical protein
MNNDDDQDKDRASKAKIRIGPVEAHGPVFGDHTVLEFVTTAIVGGITGNLAYDVLKNSFFRLWPGKHFRKRTNKMDQLDLGSVPDIECDAETSALLEYIAKAAIDGQCRRHDIPPPSLDDLKVGPWQRAEGSWEHARVARIASRSDSSFEAAVIVPDLDIAKRGVVVTIKVAQEIADSPPAN